MNRDIHARLAELERKIARAFIPATVHERSHENGVRFKIAENEDGTPVLSSWVQPPDHNTETKSRWLPAVGSQHLMITVPGSEVATTFIPLGHHDSSPNPAVNGDQTVLFDNGMCSIRISNNALDIASGSARIRLINGVMQIHGDNIQVTGDVLAHNQKDIGSTHRHGGVDSGGDLTDVPA